MTDSTEMEIFKKQLASRRWYSVGGIVVLVFGSAAIGAGAFLGSPTESLRFISLLIIAMAGLATTAAVFAGLRMASRTEAFALPSGSIRALLAIGIMVLFVVFGLPVVTEDTNTRTRFETVQVPFDEIATEFERYRGQNLIVVITDYGSKGNADGTIPDTPAQFELYSDSGGLTPAQIDLNKQLLTAIITLLTTVIGFYFGSRSTTDGQRDHTPEAFPGDNPVDLAVRLRDLRAMYANIATQLVTWQQQIASVNALPVPEDPEEAAGRNSRASQVSQQLSAAEKTRETIDTCLTKAEAALKAAATSDDPRVKVVHMAETRDAVAEAAKEMASLVNQRDAIAVSIVQVQPEG